MKEKAIGTIAISKGLQWRNVRLSQWHATFWQVKNFTMPFKDAEGLWAGAKHRV